MGGVLGQYVWNKVGNKVLGLPILLWPGNETGACGMFVGIGRLQCMEIAIVPHTVISNFSSKKAVQDVQASGKCCVLDIDMQVQSSLILEWGQGNVCIQNDQRSSDRLLDVRFGSVHFLPSMLL